MKLETIRIQGYKHLKQVYVEFYNEGQSLGNFPVRFCIGLNGSGKSVFLEAVALIFSRAAQGETPGFEYEVRYTIWKDAGEASVCMKTNRGRLELEVRGETYREAEQIRSYLPHRVIASISGRNSQMQELLFGGARDALLGDLYDLELSFREGGAEEEKVSGQLKEKLRYLRELGENARCIFIEEEMASLILFVLCAWHPLSGDQTYEMLRGKIFGTLKNGFAPALLSLQADRANVSEDLFGSLLENARIAEDGMMHAVFSLKGESGGFGAEQIFRQYGNPMTLLAVLLQARKEASLKECHVFFHLDGSQELLDETALSDGEISWIARMGLILLARQWESDNCLFLLDEPDVHLNERWNVEFVSFLRDLSSLDGAQLHHEFLVSTHSSLILTDALPEQLYLFERKRGKAVIRSVPVSSFGADRSEISQMLFENRALTGAYSEEVIEEILEKEDDPQRLRQYIEEMGPGINRFQVLNKYYEYTQRRG